MVLESIINPMKAEKEPWEMLPVGFVYSSIAIFLALWVFENEASMVAVFLTVLASVPVIFSAIKYEEEKDTQEPSEKKLLMEHSKALKFFMYLFIGVTISCALWYTVLPMDRVSLLFNAQSQTISDINGKATGAATFGLQLSTLSVVFFNNVKVLAFCILFALLYGAGAVFILTWNASVVGTAIGNFIRLNLAKYSALIGVAKVSTYFQIVSLGLFRYAIHGVPEILSYYIAGLAGGIISFAVINKDFTGDSFQKIVTDCSELIIIAILVLFTAALLEVFVTPVLF